MRLTRWHRAKIAIYQYESSTLPLHHTNWTCSLPLHFVNNPFIWDQVVIPNVIWRGGIRIGTSTVSIT